MNEHFVELLAESWQCRSGAAFRLYCQLVRRDIHDGDHSPVNFVFDRSIRQDLKLVMNSITVCKFSFHSAKVRHHLLHHGHEPGDFDRRADVR